jgi:dolichol-phosphate mannosyltransferase
VEPVPRLSLVVPTLNEAVAIEGFLAALLPVLRGLDAELILVDDRSADGTAALAERLLADEPIARRIIVREGPPSLGLSVIEGWAAARGAILGVMDADLSHPPELLPRLLEEVERGAEVAFATRYMPGGGTEGWPLPRRAASRFASGLARTLVRARDPLSGFFLLRREVLEGVELSPRGWKIGLEVLCRGRWGRLAEVPYVFRDRFQGKSKFGRRVVLDYLIHVARLHRDRLRAGELGRR